MVEVGVVRALSSEIASGGRDMSFDCLAPHYRWMEFVLAGSKLQRSRTSFLESVDAPGKALVVGEGRGRFLARLMARSPKARITCVDSSSRMLELTRRDLAIANLNGPLEFICADILQWTPEAAQYDLIATHFFLDCFRPDQIRVIVNKLSRAAKPSASWLLSDFQIPRSGLSRWRARAIVRCMYAFFRTATKLPASGLSEADEHLKGCGFSLRARRVSEWGLLRSDHWTKCR